MISSSGGLCTKSCGCDVGCGWSICADGDGVSRDTADTYEYCELVDAPDISFCIAGAGAGAREMGTGIGGASWYELGGESTILLPVLALPLLLLGLCVLVLARGRGGGRKGTVGRA